MRAPTPTTEVGRLSMGFGCIPATRGLSFCHVRSDVRQAGAAGRSGHVLIGPSRLPEYAGRLAQLVKSLRRMLDVAKDRVRDEIGPEFDDLDWKKLDPASTTLAESSERRC